MRTSLKITLSIAALASLAPMTGHAQVYDLFADFSTTQNPNGVWSYNLNGTPKAQPFQSDWAVGWGERQDMGDFIGKGTEPRVLMHTYSFRGYGTTGNSSITWTAPRDGTISIVGSAQDDGFWSFTDRDASWDVTLNGTSLASLASIRGVGGADAAASFANNIKPGQQLTGLSVHTGDVVEFMTVTTTDFGHVMGVNMTVTLTPIPEPSTCAILAGLGLVGFAGWRRMKA